MYEGKNYAGMKYCPLNRHMCACKLYSGGFRPNAITIWLTLSHILRAGVIRLIGLLIRSVQCAYFTALC